MERLSGKLEYLGWSHRPWNLITTEGSRIDLWPYFKTLLENLRGKRTAEKQTSESIVVQRDNRSKMVLAYEGQNEYSNPLLLEEDGKVGKSNLGAYLDDMLTWLSGRQVRVEVDDERIKIEANPEEKVFGLYYSVGNSCKIPEGKEREICKVGQGADCCIFMSCGEEGFMCEKFGSTARYLLDRLAKGQLNAKRIGNCAILGRKEDPELEQKRWQKMLGEEAVITQEHTDYGGKLRRVGDKARMYLGYTYGCLGSHEEPLVFEGETGFMGTNRAYFKRLNR